MKVKLINHYNLEKLSNQSSWGHRWETRSKLVTAILFIIGIVSLKSLPLLTITFGVILGAALSMKLPLLFIITRLILFLPFFILMGIPILFGSGSPPTTDAVVFILMITTKGLSSLLVMIMMISTQKIQDFFNGLANMKLPSVLVTIFFLAYRYVFLFINDLVSLRRAINSRLYDQKISKRNIRMYGEMAGGILVKSLDRSDTVYRAMASRGFDGTIPTSNPRQITRLDKVKGFIVVSFIIVIKLIEGRF